MKIEDLKQSFSEELFLRLNRILIDSNFNKETLTIEPDSSKYIISTKYFGNYDELGLHIFTVKHSSAADARVGVGMDIFKLMKKYAFQNALIASYSESSDSWRYSLVTSKLNINSNKKVVKEFSNPKRYSFVLGQNQKVLTPFKQLVELGEISDIEQLLKRFSLEVVNNDFYQKIASLYDQLIGTDKIAKQIKYPLHGDELHEFGVRLIGRIIFCWFLREKKSDKGLPLIPKSILSLEAAKQDNYYHNVLAPLFFEVLNKPIPKRLDKFQENEYSKIPYLNGGLFNNDMIDFYALDKVEGISISGEVNLPDSWLRDLFELLERFNFTVDENTSFDTDLSIDPEMLGRVFENLLARINPETGETVRKTTGSFYTPREIVEFMVDSTIEEYLKNGTDIESKKIRSLINYDSFDDFNNELTNSEQHLILEKLSTLTVFDPACGSGAYPIGMLQKIVHIITKLDPRADWWLEKQLAGASPELRREFSNRSLDYIRKLGIIRQTIFGVDIQPIATEISRLRCFLTLIVDENVNDDEDNRGIRPLPNLDFKFVTANSLISLPPPEDTKGTIHVTQGAMFEELSHIGELKNIRNEYFSSNSSERTELQLQFVNLQRKMALSNKDVFNNLGSKLYDTLSKWEPFGHLPSYWFDIEWMFGISDGFDIVIGNPPYVKKEHLSNAQITELEANYSEITTNKPKPWSDDLYVHFIFKAFELVKNNGVVSYITNDSFIGFSSKLRVRKTLLKNNLKLLITCPPETFDATIYTAVFVAMKQASDTTYWGGKFSYPDFRVTDSSIVKKEYVKTLPNERLVTAQNRIIEKLLAYDKTTKFMKILDTGIHTGNVREKILSKTMKSEEWKPILQGRQITRWAINWESKSAKYLYCNPSYVPLAIPGIGRGGKASNANEYWHFCGDKNNHFQPERLLVRQTEDDIFAAYQNNEDDGQFYTDNTLFTVLPKNNFNLKYALGLFNSKVLNYFYQYLSQEGGKTLAQIKIGLLEELPVIYDPIYEQKIVVLVGEAINVKRKNSEADISEIEEEINKLVYGMYDLNDSEIKIIENSFSE